MVITGKTKLKDSAKVEACLKCSDVDFLEEVKKYPVPDIIAGRKVKSGYDVSFEDITIFWDSKSEDEFIRQTAKTYLNVVSEKDLLNLPLIDFTRLTIHAKDIVTECSERLKAIKREPTIEEKQAGIDEMTGSEFKLIRHFMLISPLNFKDYDEAFATPWSIVISELEAEAEKEQYQSRLNDIYLKKSKQ